MEAAKRRLILLLLSKPKNPVIRNAQRKIPNWVVCTKTFSAMFAVRALEDKAVLASTTFLVVRTVGRHLVEKCASL